MTLAIERDRTFAIKQESTPGTDAVPTPASDAVLVQINSSTRDLGNVQTNEVRRALDRSVSTPGAGSSAVNVTAWLKGASAPGTTAPQCGRLLMAAGFAETKTAAAVTDTAQAGTSNTITLAAGESSTDDIFKGMVITTTGGTGSGYVGVCTGYVGSTKVATVSPDFSVTPDATTVYNIPANALWSPASDSLPTFSAREWRHFSDAGNDVLRSLVGCMSSFDLTLNAGNPCEMTFGLVGKLVKDTDVSDPGAATYDSTIRPTFLNADVYVGGTSTSIVSMAIGSNASIQMDDDARQQYGRDVASIVDRGFAGTLTLPQARVADRDIVGAWEASTKTTLWQRWGATAGNRISIMQTDCIYKGDPDDWRDGRGYVAIPYEVDALDSSIYISVY